MKWIIETRQLCIFVYKISTVKQLLLFPIGEVEYKGMLIGFIDYAVQSVKELETIFETSKTKAPVGTFRNNPNQ